jgi:hypothetical protein
MANDIDKQVAEHIREILRLVVDINGKTLRKLNELIGQTSKFELQSITNVHAKIILVQNYHVEMGQGEDSIPVHINLHPSADPVDNQQREITRTCKA